MALLSITFIWLAAAVVLLLLVLGSVLFVNAYKHRYDRDAFVSSVCVIALTSILATVCLLPVDIALVSYTTDNRVGFKKDWATEEAVASILLQLKVVYYLLYSLNAILCFLVIPFAYFLYEEQDEETTLKGRIFGALKYSIGLILLLLILFLVGFFIPIAQNTDRHMDLDYFKKLLTENHGERALTFITGVLLSLGTILYVFYSATGLALLPVSLIKSVPAESTVEAASQIRQELLENQESQRILESSYNGRNGRFQLSDKDRRQLEHLQRRERTLLRKQRLEEESRQVTAWTRFKAALRPFTLLVGLLILLVAIMVWISMLLTSIDKVQNSICGKHCGFILAHLTIFNPTNWLLVTTSRLFPLDYALTILLVLDFSLSTIVGISFLGIRFLWITLFKVRRHRTYPQGLLLTTIMLALTVLAFNYSLPMIIAPQYGHFGSQTYCSKIPDFLDNPRDAPFYCKHHPELIRPCTESANTTLCTPTVVSTFINRVTLNYPFFGVFAFWAQFAFLGVFIVVVVAQLVRAPRVALDEEDDEDLTEEEEEESLLGGTRRRVNAAWEDMVGRDEAGASGISGTERAGVGARGYGSTSEEY